jgi:hypothetical protein
MGTQTLTRWCSAPSAGLARATGSGGMLERGAKRPFEYSHVTALVVPILEEE